MNKLSKNIIFNIIISFVLFFTAFAYMAVNFSYQNFKNSAINENQLVSELQNNDFSDIASRATFDSRDFGWVTPVSDQGSSNLCWAYSSISAAETSILKSGIDSSATKDNLTLSPKNLAYSRHFRGSDPLGNTAGEYTGENWLMTAGAPFYCASLFSQWCGPTDNLVSAGESQFGKGKYRLTNAVHINSDDIYKIKLAIAQYGAITFSYNNVREAEYYNPKMESSSGVAHAVTIVGWDDSIPANKFVPAAASQNGAWIIKNSYNSLPYFYLSYDNKSSEKYAFEFSLKEENENNYFYDSSLKTALSSTINKNCSMFANVFEAKKGENDFAEYVKAVNIGINNKNVSLKVKIYTNLTDSENPQSGTLSGEGNSYFDFGGYRTIQLNSPVRIEKGSNFAVVVDVSSNNDDNAEILFSEIGGKSSFRFKDYWSSVNATAAIKAITSTSKDDTQKLSIEDAEMQIQNDEFVYNGLAVTPSITVKHNGNLLTEYDYSVSYENNVNAGTATIIVKGRGKYVGEKSVSFTIKKADKPNVLPQDIIKVKYEVTNLSQISLPTGWSFKDINFNLLVGENIVVAEYDDKLNYTNYSKNIIVLREEKEEIPTLPPDPTEPEAPPPVEPEEPEGPEVTPPSEPSLPNEKPDNPQAPDNGKLESPVSKLWWLMIIPISLTVVAIILIVLKFKKMI